MAEQDKDQKTEDATAKRLEEAVQKGQVVNSQEVKTLFMLLAATSTWNNLLQRCLGWSPRQSNLSNPLVSTASIWQHVSMEKIGTKVGCSLAVLGIFVN